MTPRDMHQRLREVRVLYQMTGRYGHDNDCWCSWCQDQITSLNRLISEEQSLIEAIGSEEPVDV